MIHECTVIRSSASALAGPRAGFGEKFKVKRQKPADSDERETLHYARTVIRPGDRILYIHSKGVSDARCDPDPNSNPNPKFIPNPVHLPKGVSDVRCASTADEPASCCAREPTH